MSVSDGVGGGGRWWGSVAGTVAGTVVAGTEVAGEFDVVDFTRNSVWFLGLAPNSQTVEVRGCKRPRGSTLTRHDITYLIVPGNTGGVEKALVDVTRTLTELDGVPHTTAETLARVAQSPDVQSHLDRGKIQLIVGRLADHQIATQVVQPMVNAADKAAADAWQLAQGSERTKAKLEAAGVDREAFVQVAAKVAKKLQNKVPATAQALSDTLQNPPAKAAAAGSVAAATEDIEAATVPSPAELSHAGPLLTTLLEAEARGAEEPVVPEIGDDVPNMSWEQTRLLKYATERGIDTSKARGRTALLALIRAHEVRG